MDSDYILLGISKNSSLNEIKKSYYKLANKYHPNKNSSTDAGQKFADIKKSYDRIIKSYKLRATEKINVTLEDIWRQQKKNIKIKWKKCANCAEQNKCHKCFGAGYILVPRVQYRMKFNTKKTCDACAGNKYAGTCGKCRDGYVPANIDHEINLTHNTKHGDNIDIDGQNYVIDVAEHPIFLRIGNNIVTCAQITLSDALAADRKPIILTDLSGKEIVIPVGKIIHNNETITFENKGFNGGDLVIVFDIIFPETIAENGIDRQSLVYRNDENIVFSPINKTYLSLRDIYKNTTNEKCTIM